MHERVPRAAMLAWIGATISTALGALTIAWRDWIEVVFHVDPDGHNGSIETTIVLACFALTTGLLAVGLGWTARRRSALPGRAEGRA